MRRKIFTAIYLILLAAITFNVYKHVTVFYVTARFAELGPVSKSMPVYYKGFKVGKTGKIMPDADFKSTDIKIIFNKDMSILPVNVYAKVKKFEDKKQYLEIEYPETPDEKILTRGSRIEGKTEADINSFMSSQLESGALGAMSENANNTISAAKDLMNEITSLVHAARPDILAATKNLSQTTEQINDLTTKLNLSAPQKDVNEASTNIGETIANVEQISENINSITAKLDTTMDSVNATMFNVQIITSGVNQTLSKRFGGARLIVGTPVQKSGEAGRACTSPTPPVLRPSAAVPCP